MMVWNKCKIIFKVLGAAGFKTMYNKKIYMYETVIIKDNDGLK
jgi:hypothetical protein